MRPCRVQAARPCRTSATSRRRAAGRGLSQVKMRALCWRGALLQPPSHHRPCAPRTGDAVLNLARGSFVPNQVPPGTHCSCSWAPRQVAAQCSCGPARAAAWRCMQGGAAHGRGSGGSRWYAGLLLPFTPSFICKCRLITSQCIVYTSIVRTIHLHERT